MAIPEHVRHSRFERDFVFLAAIFTVLMVLTNIIGTKLFLLFPDLLPQGFGWITDYHYVVLTTGLVTYPLTFLFTDVCSEVYGRRRANYMVTLGFIASLLMLVVINIAGWVPRADRYWADAAGQPRQGTQVLVDTAAGSTAVEVDDASHLLPGPGQTAWAAAIVDGKAVPFGYEELIKPMQETPGEDGTPQNGPVRWDNRGALQTTSGLAAPVPADAWVVPAVRITELLDDGQVKVDRPRILPFSGGLLTEGGSVLSYSYADDTGVLAPSPAWNNRVDLPAEGLQVGDSLAIYNMATPAQLQQNLVSIISAPAVLLFASMLAYLVAQYLDVWLYHFWKRVTKGRYLWVRNNGSTFISQLVDTIIVNGIFLTVAFGMDAWDVTKVIICVYIVKMCLAILDTPLIYLATWWAKRRLGYGWYDEVDTNLLGTEEGYGDRGFFFLRLWIRRGG